MMNLIKKEGIKRSARAGSWYMLGSLLGKAAAFIAVPIFARLLSAYEYGIVSTYLSWAAILTLFAGLSLGSSIRTAYLDFEESLDKYMSSVLFLSVISFMTLSTVVMTAIYVFEIKVDIRLAALCLLQAYMTFVIDYIMIKYMMQVKYKERTLLLTLPNVIITIVSIVLLMYFLKEDLYMGRIIPYVMINTVLGTAIFISIIKKGKKLIDLEYWKYAAAISIPLVFHGLSIVALSQSDRIMITALVGPGPTGIYSLVYNFSMIITVVHSSLDGVWIPWFTNKLKEEKKEEINDRAKLYMNFMAFITIVLLFISPEILVLLTPEEYWSGKYLIPPIMLSSFIIFLYSKSVDVEYYYKSTKRIATNTIIAAMLNILLNFILIPVYGAIAAAYTTLVSYMVSFAIHCITARKLDNGLLPLKLYLRPLLVTIMMTIIVYLLMDYAAVRWAISSILLVIYLFIMLKGKRYKCIWVKA